MEPASLFGGFRRMRLWLRAGARLGVCLTVAAPAVGATAEWTHYAREIKEQLAHQIMPYWHDHTVDRLRGGYVLADSGSAVPAVASEKQLVTQARMIWGFAHAHRKGLGDRNRDYLEAARQGREFLRRHFHDAEHGGYYWTTDLEGRALNRNKIVYGQAFVIYGLVEYYRASGETAALEEALALYHGLQQKAHDRKHGGWIEHFQADWTPILAPSPAAAVEVAGYKSANTHLHLMEAFTELYETSRDARVRQSLEEALRLNRKYFYPPKPGRSCFHRRLDWSEVTDPASAGLSYGHNVEFAWLMIRAQQVLGRKPAWTHFHAHLDHALKFGYDPDRGGLYNRGFDDQPATQRDKIWWVQAEMLAALTDAMKHRPRPAYAEALESLLHFIRRHQADDRDGVWFDTVGPDGTPKNRAKAHNWKANYHDVRALVKFVEAFEGAGAFPQRQAPSPPFRPEGEAEW